MRGGTDFFDGKLKRQKIEKTENWNDRNWKYRKLKMPKIEKTEKMNLDVQHDYRIKFFQILTPSVTTKNLGPFR